VEGPIYFTLEWDPAPILMDETQFYVANRGEEINLKRVATPHAINISC